MTTKVLSVASEIFPLIKTGGLADVVGALPHALEPFDIETRTLVPGYPSVMKAIGSTAGGHWPLGTLFGGAASLIEAHVHGLDLFVLDAPHLFDRPGGPYITPGGYDHPDNWKRFAALAQAGAAAALGAVKGFRADIVHAHDWQSALTPVYLSFAPGHRPKTVLTIHNLSFQGNYPASVFPELGLPLSAWSMEGVEYYGNVGYLKGGIRMADAITTVSPSYAQEILTREGGMGLDGLLSARADRLYGIVNGIDDEVWNPATDPAVPFNYTVETLDKRQENKRALEAEFALAPGDGPIFSIISRLTWQKGLDLLAGMLDEVVTRGIRLVVVGSGEPGIEEMFRDAAARHPDKIGLKIGYDEPVSHRIQAGADGIIVPSRFEPCGLTQLYALRYGCVPIVARVGGLADTVIDANFAAVAAGVATGFLFSPFDSEHLFEALDRAARLYEDKTSWRSVQLGGMRSDVSWAASAKRYADLYRELLQG
ncbi:glycogen synthase GlgA [Consotaella salsifontis]|uniref:Glycogen synthase n=1 Tax=Consotaella salsifontis TaxID=1365950 RepID=A0A1T4PXQ8_9HYPH|nr:glycogen synthase GlgA [Consotaella salsifontis]SJZ96279.1 starch synthase [Consotaella salsifontis]